MFYSRSSRAMWDPEYSKKFWTGVKLPKFRITINKAFEMVAIYAPSLFWEVPHRTVEAKRPLDISPEFFGMGEQGQAFFQQFGMMQQQSEVQDKAIAHLMDRWLNYTPREQPGGGLAGHSERCVIDSLIKGRGVLATRPYKMPGSGRNLTGSFRESPDNIYLDPDFDSVEECRWMAIKHIDVHSEVERRFKLPKDSLRGKASLESSWQFGELASDDQSSAHRKEGQTNDLVVWYEIFSKAGVGVRSTSMDAAIREHMDQTVGQYAYVAVCADVPYPLNMPAESLRKGATDETVKQSFSWPVPFWADDKWPVELLDFYIDPESAWPLPPLAPGLGELKLLNFLISWFANRTWSSSRDFWAVAQPHIEHYREYILNGDDQAIIPTPVGMKSPKEAIEILTQPESRQDMTKLIGFVSDMFDKRVGLTATIYGQNENNTQNRTAEETASKNRSVQIRPEYMQKQVVSWQSRVAQSEAFVTRWFVTAEDVEQFLGPAGAMLWRQHIESTDVELVVRQFQYSVAASSIRRPNRERDIGNYQQVMGQFAPVLAEFGQQTGNYTPFNGMMSEWGRLHDADMESLMVPVPPPPSEEEQQQQAAIEQQQQQLAMAEIQAKVEKLNAEAQAKNVESQIRPMEMQGQQAMAQVQLQTEQLRQQGEALRQQGDQAKTQAEMAKMQLQQQLLEMKSQIEQQAKSFDSQMEMMRDMQVHEQELIQDEEVHDQELRQKAEMAALDIQAKKQQIAIQKRAAEEKAKEASEPSESGETESNE